MDCQKQKQGKDYQITIKSLKKKFKVRLRQEQLQKIFRTLRTTIIHLDYEHIYPQASLPFQQPLQLPLHPPANMQPVYQYLMRFIPPHIPMVQPMITGQNANQIQENNQRLNHPPKSYEIYFQTQNFRVFKKLIGEGSFSKVWLGVDLLKNEQIAAKEVKKLQESEMRCLKQLNSPNIIKVLDIVRHKSLTFIVLQFCSKNLREELVDCKYDLVKALGYFQQIVKGMNVLQQNNIIHRDLKFQNILLRNNVIKVADFGLAKFLGDEIEIQSRRCGSPYTMAPQIYFSNSYYPSYTSKCDIWSLGVILHEMLYKQHPYGKNKQNFKKGRRIKLKRKFGVLDLLVDRCLVENPRKRADWSQFLQIFEKYYVDRNRYFQIDIFPIDCESIVYHQNATKKKSLMNGPQGRDEKFQRKSNEQDNKIRERECIQKMMNDFDVYGERQPRKAEKQKAEKKQLIQKGNRVKNIIQEKPNSLVVRKKEQASKPVKKHNQENYKQVPLYIEYTQEMYKTKKIQQAQQTHKELISQPHKQQITKIKIPKTNVQSNASRIRMQISLLGILIVFIYFLIFSK